MHGTPRSTSRGWRAPKTAGWRPGTSAANGYANQPIHAGTPSEGRAERANGTLQDRLVLHDAEELALILSRHHVRKLSKNLTFRFERREHQLTGEGKGHRLRGAAVTVCQGFDGSVAVLLKGRRLAFRVLAEGGPSVAVEDEKGCGTGWTRRRRRRRRGRTGSRRRTIRGAARSSPLPPSGQQRSGWADATGSIRRRVAVFPSPLSKLGGSRPWKTVDNALRNQRAVSVTPRGRYSLLPADPTTATVQRRASRVVALPLYRAEPLCFELIRNHNASKAALLK